MADPLHFFRTDFGGADIHMPVYLHGIRRDDLSVHRFRKIDRSARLPTAVGPVNIINGRFIAAYSYTIRLNFFSSSLGHSDDRRTSVWTMIWIIQRSSSPINVHFPRRQSVVSFHCRFA